VQLLSVLSVTEAWWGSILIGGSGQAGLRGLVGCISSEMPPCNLPTHQTTDPPICRSLHPSLPPLPSGEMGFGPSKKGAKDCVPCKSANCT
jgi:hypothetical protein